MEGLGATFVAQSRVPQAALRAAAARCRRRHAQQINLFFLCQLVLYPPCDR